MKTSLADFDFLDPTTFIITCIAMFFMVMIRYFILSGFFHSYFYLWKKEEWKLRKINAKAYPPEQFKKEITWSTLTAVLFSVIGAFTAVLWQKGYTQLYTDLHWYDVVWFPCSIVISMLIHETYYYWVHRWMHHPKIYHLVHKIHHDSKITSAWTAFSFHPIEGLLEALIMPVIICIIPMHIYAATVHLTIMTITAAINHLDIEIYPKTKWGNWLGKIMIGATHHSHHHKYYRYNFGLYFTFWDKIGKTESPKFQKEFEERA